MTESQLRMKIRKIIAETRVLKEYFGDESYYVNRGGQIYVGDENGNEVKVSMTPDDTGLFEDGDMVDIDDLNEPYSRRKEMSW